MAQEFITLSQLQTMLKEGIEQSVPESVWVRVEISSVKARPGGHCYMEVSETDPNGRLAAKATAIIWSSRYRILLPYFIKSTGGPIAASMTALLRVRVNYSELYGLSLIVDDISPEVTLGQQELLRRQTIERLKVEGIFDMQKELALPALPYDIAVVSAPDAAGYRDFMRHLHENEYGFQYKTTLYQATMQGKEAPASIADAMDRALEGGHEVLVIMRGGGASLDLACFDDYSLAAAIAQYPLPVMTALGHDQDYHVSDMVANTFVKTPTALADYLIDMYADEDAMLQSYVSRLKMGFMSKISLMESRLLNLETKIRSADPRNILSKGYTLMLDHQGVVLKKAGACKTGDHIGVMFADGRVDCVVETVRTNEK